MGIPSAHEPGSAIRGRVEGVDHVTLPVGDLGLAERFYVGLLGAELLFRLDEAFLRSVGRAEEVGRHPSALHTSVRFGGGPRLDLFLQPWGQPAGAQPHPHLALAVAPAALLPIRETLNAHGVPTDGPRRLGPPGQASLYFNDPFGNHLEFVAVGYTEELPIGAPDLAALVYAWRG